MKALLKWEVEQGGKHTSGPWEKAGQITVGPVSTVALAQVCEGVPEWRANARLIAATPELLEALKRMIHPNNPEPWDVVEANARVAIAKAEGR